MKGVSDIGNMFHHACNIVVMFTDEHYMYVEIRELRRVRYNTMPYLHSYPVAVLLFGEILLLGMESGAQTDIFIYIYWSCCIEFTPSIFIVA